MLVKQSGGRIYGAHLTAKEKRAMDIEINRQIAESDRQHANEIDALVLYQLRVQLGFGPKRLHRFWEQFVPALEELIRHYEMPDDGPWLCMQELKKAGVDVEAWNRERKEQYEAENQR